ncbi:MAG TPA: radical SAM protein [Actinomycetes bacterium]|jgi:DNA repair photolyase|nr:radical SAM protein [Actinomycetes bacterium]
MRTFSDLRGEQPQRPGVELPLFEAPAVVRTFDTPEFRDVTFYEVEAKSVLNRVPAASRMGFEWTINVYRGCSHACVYCMGGDTPILMADGRTKPLAQVRTADAIYGTVWDGRRRRYAKTEVLAHWATVEPAYRVTLDDGTELIASGDHRFLSRRGWKHVTGSRRPRLTASDELMGTGRFASPPEAGVEYRRGYLCGMLRGDSHLGRSWSPRPRRARGDADRSRPALVHLEALRRVRRYLTELDATTDELLFQEAVGADSARPAVSAAAGPVAWPHGPTTEWCKGFLAGIFDAEGSYGSDGALRVRGADAALVEKIVSCLRRLGFLFALDTGPQPKPLMDVRLRGGLREHLRFFHTVDPATPSRRAIAGRVVDDDAPPRVVSIAPLGVDLPLYDITTGTGDFIANGVVSHNCFARPSHTYLNFGAGRDFERKIVVKVNAPEVLRRELRRPSWSGAHVAMGTNTDPYQRGEGRYRLTRGVLEALRDYANPCSILTKSPLLLRDLDLFTELAEVAGFAANLSVGTLDEEVWRRTEPDTPHPRARMEAVKALNRAGVPCGVLIAPILPRISDSPAQLQAVVRAAADAGATHVSPITLHLRPGVKEEFMPWLEREYPELVAGYRRMYRGSNAPEVVRRAIGERVQAARRHHPAARLAEPITPRLAPAEGHPAEPATQLSLLD